jgi:hypothetical protein
MEASMRGDSARTFRWEKIKKITQNHENNKKSRKSQKSQKITKISKNHKNLIKITKISKYLGKSQKISVGWEKISASRSSSHQYGTVIIWSPISRKRFFQPISNSRRVESSYWLSKNCNFVIFINIIWQITCYYCQNHVGFF